MLIVVCPHCAANYQVSPDAIGATGRPVRCVRCGNVWTQVPPADAPALSTTALGSPEPASDAVVAAFRAELTQDAPPNGGELPPGDAWPPEGASIARDDAPPDAPMTDAAESGEPAAAADLPELDGSDTTPLAPELPGEFSQSETHAEAGTDVESAVRQRRRPTLRAPRAMPRGPLPIVIVALGVVLAGLIGWRGTVVRHAPQMASLYRAIGLPVNLRGLAFKEIQTANGMHDGVPLLVVEGTLVNIASTPVEVPRLRFAMRNEAGIEIYSWTAIPTKQVLAPGETLPFRSRLAAPPGEGRSVVVRFFTRGDAVAGLR